MLTSLCDERVYNMDSKQNDIKYMKRLDFAGLYYIKNITKKKCYVGRADNVYKKVERHFKGHENQEIFNDFNDVVNITLHFFLKDIRPMLPPAMNHSIAVS